MKPMPMYSGTVSGSTPIATTDATHTTRVVMRTGRMPRRPMSRLVNGPAMACPIEVAASTRPAAPYDPVWRSTCSRNARESIPEGNRAISWAAMMRATPEVLRRSE
jgi:hypothetical protein